MAAVTHENSYVSTDNDMGTNHEKSHDKQHKYQQEGEPNVETLTDNKLEDLSTDLALEMAQKQGLKSEDEWETYNAGLRASRRKDSYTEYVAGTAGNLIKSKRRVLDKGMRVKVKDEKTGKLTKVWKKLGKQKREQVAQELASIDKNMGIPIDGSLYYVSNTMVYDQMNQEELKKYRKFERKTFEDFYNSSTFKKLNPGCFRAEIHFDENGAIHLQTQDVWYRVDSLNRAKYAKSATIKDILVEKYGSEDSLNRQIDVLSYLHEVYDKAPGSRDRIGSPTVASMFWKMRDEHGFKMGLADEARTDKNGKVWSYRHSPRERDARIEELWRMEQIKSLAEIATENAKVMGIDWTLDTTYTTDGIHKTGSAYVQHKESMKGVNIEKVAVGKKVNKLSHEATKQKHKVDSAVKAKQEAIDALKTAYEATTGRQAKNDKGEDLSPLEMSNGLKKAVSASQEEAKRAQVDEATAKENANDLKAQAESSKSARDEAQQQLERLQQRIRQRQQQRRKELQEEIDGNNLLFGGVHVDVTSSKFSEKQVDMYAKKIDQWKQSQRDQWQQDKASHDKLVSDNSDLAQKNADLVAQNKSLKQDSDKLTQSVRSIYQVAIGKEAKGLTAKDMVIEVKSELGKLSEKVKSLTVKVAKRLKDLTKEPSSGEVVKAWLLGHWKDRESNGRVMYGTGLETQINNYALNKELHGEKEARNTLFKSIDNVIDHDNHQQHKEQGTLGEFHNAPIDDNRQF